MGINGLPKKDAAEAPEKQNEEEKVVNMSNDQKRSLAILDLFEKTLSHMIVAQVDDPDGFMMEYAVK